MADVTINTQLIDRVGLSSAVYTGSLSTADTYLVTNNGRVFLHFKKTGVGAAVITIQTPGKVDGLDIAERTVTVPATTGDVFIGPFPEAIYNQSGSIKWSTSDVAGLTVAALRLQG